MQSDSNFHLRWTDFEAYLSDTYRKLRSDLDLVDVALSCSDSDGRILKAHKLVLSASSSFFKNIFNQQLIHDTNGMPFVYLRGVSFAEMSSILDFIYYGEVNVTHSGLSSFLGIADEFQIQGLTKKDDGMKTDFPLQDNFNIDASRPPLKRKQKASKLSHKMMSRMSPLPLDGNFVESLSATENNFGIGEIQKQDKYAGEIEPKLWEENSKNEHQDRVESIYETKLDEEECNGQQVSVTELLKNEEKNIFIPPPVFPELNDNGFNLGESNGLKDDIFHHLEPIPSSGKRQRPQRKCKLCYKMGRRKETRYHCVACPNKPSLCLIDCFKEYHTLLAQVQQ